MRAVAIASSSPSHIDLGGNGFLRVVQRLRTLGHDVEWLTHGSTAERLRALGWTPRDAPEIEAARLIVKWPTIEALVSAARHLATVISGLRPDVLIVDRVNTLCAAIARQLDVPCVAIGTPGGYWRQARRGVMPAAAPPETFLRLSEALEARLGWRHVAVHSAWLQSGEINLVFVGRTFYEGVASGASAAYVNVFEPHARDVGDEGGSLGIVLGQTGSLARMRLVLEYLARQGEFGGAEAIDVLAGGRAESNALDETLAALPPRLVTRHGWTDYAAMYGRMRRVISFGGIGAIWHALNRRLPMLVVDGGYGDQRFNCRAIARLDVGGAVSWNADEGELAAAHARWREDSGSLAAVDALRAPENYSDTLESAADRIVRVAN